jgi:hypothetical protein
MGFNSCQKGWENLWREKFVTPGMLPLVVMGCDARGLVLVVLWALSIEVDRLRGTIGAAWWPLSWIKDWSKAVWRSSAALGERRMGGGRARSSSSSIVARANVGVQQIRGTQMETSR